MYIVAGSESVKSPRSRHGSPNRGGLANHVLQGSLRLTASRHHILANSGMEIDLNKRKELNRGLPQYFQNDDDKTSLEINDNDLLLEHSVSSRRVRKPSEKARKTAATDALSEVVSQKRQKGILKSTERKILRKAKRIKMRRNKRTTRSSNRRTLVLENKKETEVVRSPVSLKSPVSIKSPTSSEDGSLRRLRGRAHKNVSLESEPQQSPADDRLSSSELEVPSGASEMELTARTALPRKRGEKRQRSLSLSSPVTKPKRKRKPQMEQWDRQLFGRKRRTQSLSTDLDKKASHVDTDELFTKATHDLRTRNKSALHSTSNGIVTVHPSLSDLKQLDELNPDKVLTECLTNGTSSLKSTAKVNKRRLTESDYIPQYFDVVWAKCKGFKPYPALVRSLLIFMAFFKCAQLGCGPQNT